LNESAWDNITELESLPPFNGLVSSFEQNERDWKAWYLSSSPEETPLPAEWENKLGELQKMLIIRSIRVDRVLFCSTSFVANNLGQRYIDPPILDIPDVLAGSSPRTPLIFVLSPGVDPTTSLQQLAQKLNMEQKFHYLSLGQGQAPKATKLIQEGIKMGTWVFLANCHLSISYMPTLDKIIESIPSEKPHADFRLWLSSSPHPQFPISILQSGLKMTTEPPKGIRANMSRLFSSVVTDEAYNRCSKREVYNPLLFSLAFFHSILLERKKFLTLGWNVVCDFNDSDFDICENLTVVLLEEYIETPWEALKYLIAEANYGGRVTDDWDRRILRSYINHLFNDEAVTTPQYKLSNLSNYYIPEGTEMQHYRDYINSLPASDKPEVFGQHPNADIASQMRESTNILDTLLSLMPQTSNGQAGTVEEKVMTTVQDLEKRVPELIDYETTYASVKHDMNPFNVVLLQEIKRYNHLLNLVKKALEDLQKGIMGLIVMNSELEEAFNSIYEGKVPSKWGTAYSSMKPLAGWMRDLILRVDHFSGWSKGYCCFNSEMNPNCSG
jgi:dynein heavy chain